MIFDDNICALGEGPLWHPEREQFFWFDILNKRLHTPGRYWQFDNYVSAAGWIDRDTLMIASDKALLRFDIETGGHVKVCDLEADNPLTRSNDGRADPQGGFWIGTMGLNAEFAAGAIWRYYRGELRTIVADVTISNAICFAPGGTTAYFCDSRTKKIMHLTLDADGWPKGPATVFIDLSHEDFSPDGAVVDVDGNLWNAQWGAGRIAQYGPDGLIRQTLHFSAMQTTCPAFGGTDLKTLFCTSATQGLDAPGPDDGKTFAVPTLATGQAEHRVIL